MLFGSMEQIEMKMALNAAEIKAANLNNQVVTLIFRFTVLDPKTLMESDLVFSTTSNPDPGFQKGWILSNFGSGAKIPSDM